MLHTLGQGGGGGGGGGISFQQILQILFVVLIFGGSFLQWLFKKLAEKAAERERTIARQRQQEEALRTGRTDGQPLPQAAPIPGSTDDAKRRLQEIAAKRRAQLEQAARGQAPVPTPPPAQQPAPAQPVFAPAPVPQPAPPRPAKPKAKLSQRQRQERERAAAEARAPEPRRSPQPAPARRQLAPQTASARELAVTAAGLAVDSPREASGSTPGPAPAVRSALTEMVGPSSATTDWRKAFIMAELLKRPLSDREFDEP